MKKVRALVMPVVAVAAVVFSFLYVQVACAGQDVPPGVAKQGKVPGKGKHAGWEKGKHKGWDKDTKAGEDAEKEKKQKEFKEEEKKHKELKEQKQYKESKEEKKGKE